MTSCVEVALQDDYHDGMGPGEGRSRRKAVTAGRVAASVAAGLLLAGTVRAQDPGPSPAPAEAARKVPALDPGLTPAFHLIRAGRHPEARRAAEAYLASGAAAHPGQAQFILGLSYHRQRLYESAHAHFASALELEPDYVTAYFFHGFTLLNLGRLDEARKALETYLARGPEDPEAVFGRGLVALEQDRVDDAEQAFLRAIALGQAKGVAPVVTADAGEDIARYYARLADVHLRRGDLPKARAALERSVELWPGHFEPWHKLAGVLRRLGDVEGAERAQARSELAFQQRTGRTQP
jgi:tetratricopeptide (TPR) repeat protein